MKLIIDFTDNNIYQKLDDIKKIGSIENVSTFRCEEFNNVFNDLNSNDSVNEINYLKGKIVMNYIMIIKIMVLIKTMI